MSYINVLPNQDIFDFIPGSGGIVITGAVDELGNLNTNFNGTMRTPVQLATTVNSVSGQIELNFALSSSDMNSLKLSNGQSINFQNIEI